MVAVIAHLWVTFFFNLSPCWFVLWGASQTQNTPDCFPRKPLDPYWACRWSWKGPTAPKKMWNNVLGVTWTLKKSPRNIVHHFPTLRWGNRSWSFIGLHGNPKLGKTQQRVLRSNFQRQDPLQMYSFLIILDILKSCFYCFSLNGLRQEHI